MTIAAAMRSDTVDDVIPESRLSLVKKVLGLNQHVEQLAQAIFNIGVHGASDGSFTESSARAEIKAIVDLVADSVFARVRHLKHTTEEEDKSKHGDTEADAGERGHRVLMLNEAVQVMEEGHEQSSDQLPLKATRRRKKRPAPAKTSSVRKKISSQKPRIGGIDEEAKGRVVEQKKRYTRALGWTDKQTDLLLAAHSKMRNVGQNIGKSKSNEPFWDCISKKLQDSGPKRTGDQCRERMDTLKKSYRKITEYCEINNMGFSQLCEVDFQKMKPRLAARLTERWYNHIRDKCPPRPKANIGKSGAGSPPDLTKNSDVLSSASVSGRPSTDLTAASSLPGPPRARSFNPDALAPKVVTSFDSAEQSQPTLAAVEPVICTLHVAKLWILILPIDRFVFLSIRFLHACIFNDHHLTSETGEKGN